MSVQTLLTDEQRDLLADGCDPDIKSHGKYYLAYWDVRDGCYVIYEAYTDEAGEKTLYLHESEFVEAMLFVAPLDQWDWEGC